MEYTTGNYLNNQINPDIENSEILAYDITSPGQPKITIRVEAGGTQYKDRIALVTNRNDSNFIGPIIYNLGGEFTTIAGSYDSVFRYPAYTINNKVFENVVKVVIYAPVLYKEIYYAKNIGLIARREKSGRLFYAKSFSIKK
jgi:hypothetical protein